MKLASVLQTGAVTDWQVTLSSPVQPAKTLLSRAAILAPSTMSFRLVQPLNASKHIVLTVFGISTLARLVQPANISVSIFVMLANILTFSKPVQPKNDPLPSFVTLAGTVMSPVRLGQFLNV